MKLKQHNIRLDDTHVKEIIKKHRNLSAWVRKEIKKEYTRILKERKNAVS